MVKYILILSLLVFSSFMNAQVGQEIENQKILTYEEYIGYVKKHHPIIKQANLILSSGEAKLLKARGGFDPKLTADYERKDFKDLEYFDNLDAKFKIPTWYGVELQAGYERNEGEFLNPQNFVVFLVDQKS